MSGSLIPAEESRSFLDNPGIPAWQKILNIDASRFERSRYAGQAQSPEGKHRLKDLNILREIAPNTYQSAAEEVKEYSEQLFETRGQFRKYKLGRKLGSIPMLDMALHPELGYDKSAQDKYFKDHPELKTKEM